jgi:hypothetical protein
MSTFTIDPSAHVLEPSGDAPGCWYTQPDGTPDYTDGSVTRVSVHLDGWTEAEERAIHDAIVLRQQ